MSAFNGIDAFWYVVAAFCVATGTALALTFRRAGRWIFAKVKQGYLDWFQEAVDEHIGPKLTAVSDAATQDAVKFREDLLLHTQEEGRLVREVVREELAPIREDLFEMNKVVVGHLKSDEENFTQGREDLHAGQAVLVSELQEIRIAIGLSEIQPQNTNGS